MRIDDAGLSVAVAAPDRLVVALIGVREPDERHAGAVLVVQSLACDLRLGDHDAELTVGEREEPVGLLVRAQRTVHVDRAGDEPRQLLRLVVQGAPQNPRLVRLGSDKLGRAGAPVGQGLAAHLGASADAAEVGGEELPLGLDVDVHDLRDHPQTRQVVAGVVVAHVRGLAQGDGPRRHPLQHRAASMALEAPPLVVVDEVRREHVRAAHLPEELGLIRQLLGVVWRRRRGAREPVRDALEVSDEHVAGRAVRLLEDRRLVEHDGDELGRVEMLDHLVVRHVQAGVDRVGPGADVGRVDTQFGGLPHGLVADGERRDDEGLAVARLGHRLGPLDLHEGLPESGVGPQCSASDLGGPSDNLCLPRVQRRVHVGDVDPDIVRGSHLGCEEVGVCGHDPSVG